MVVFSVSRIGALTLALLCCAPLLSLIVMAAGSETLLLHPAIAPYVGSYLVNSVAIALGAGILALFIGSYAAWYVVRYRFALRGLLQWLLLLPLAMPAYLLAMVYGHLLDVAGVVQVQLRSIFGLTVGEYWFPEIRSPLGVVLVIAFSLYPYVYLIARQAFSDQCRHYFEAAWLQGLAPRRWLWRVAMPVARPALVLGVTLVMMEAIADFGVVSLFGVQTFTTGIYRAWYGLAQPEQAALLAVFLLGVVALMLMLERASRSRMNQQKLPAVSGAPLTPLQGSLYHSCACALPVLIGFVIPLAQFLVWASQRGAVLWDERHWQAAKNSVLLGLAVALLALLLALCFAYVLRREEAPRWQQALVRLATLGYGIPGSVIAVAIFMPLLGLDRMLADAWQQLTGQRLGLLLTGSMAAMVLACSIRFLAVAMASIESGLHGISRRIDDAALMLGVRGLRLSLRLHLPHLKLPLLMGGFMVFADTIKELPASLLLRPFNVSTLSIRTYELASDAQLVQASVPALQMVVIGVVAVLVLIAALSCQSARQIANEGVL